MRGRDKTLTTRPTQMLGGGDLERVTRQVGPSESGEICWTQRTTAGTHHPALSGWSARKPSPESLNAQSGTQPRNHADPAQSPEIRASRGRPSQLENGHCRSGITRTPTSTTTPGCSDGRFCPGSGM